MTPAERAVLARYPDAECWQRSIMTGYAVYSKGWNHIEEARLLGTGPAPDAAWANAAARLDIEIADSHILSVPGSPVPSARPLPERTAQ